MVNSDGVSASEMRALGITQSYMSCDVHRFRGQCPSRPTSLPSVALPLGGQGDGTRDISPSGSNPVSSLINRSFLYLRLHGVVVG